VTGPGILGATHDWHRMASRLGACCDEGEEEERAARKGAAEVVVHVGFVSNVLVNVNRDLSRNQGQRGILGIANDNKGQTTTTEMFSPPSGNIIPLHSQFRIS
jgi:hypothetical protein